MVFNVTFNNISVISWLSVLLVEETRVPGENHRRPASSQTKHHIILYRVHLAWAGFELTALVVIGTDCMGHSKSNYHTITTMMAPYLLWELMTVVCFNTETLYITGKYFMLGTSAFNTSLVKKSCKQSTSQ
jgi:hypothetical protein